VCGVWGVWGVWGVATLKTDRQKMTIDLRLNLRIKVNDDNMSVIPIHICEKQILN
jgi:hypothetical protein